MGVFAVPGLSHGLRQFPSWAGRSPTDNIGRSVRSFSPPTIASAAARYSSSSRRVSLLVIRRPCHLSHGSVEAMHAAFHASKKSRP